MNLRRALAALLALSIMVGSTGYSVVAAQTPPPGPGTESGEFDEVTPPRVSYLHGEVSFWRPGAEDWGPATLNTPLAPGDTLYASAGGNFELQVAPRAFVRAGDGTQIGLDNQDPDFVQLRVTEGHVAIDVRDLPAGDTIEIGTPNAAFTIERPGFYRLDVSQESTAFRAHRGGVATMSPAGGAEAQIASDRQVVVVGTESPRVEAGVAMELTAWDRWNYERTDALLNVSVSRYVPAGVYGAETLAQHGSWRTVETYGNVWVPTRVAAGWSPYSTGRWIWDPRYGWTWIDDAPWGWAPYHYGRWVHVSNYWAWAPGPVVVRPVYSPALVVFLGGGVSVGVGRPIGWAPLGWGEPVIPWWGRPGFVGRPYWGGWGGPRVVNNTVINRNTTVNVTNINVYKNVHVTNAVVGVPADRFGRGGERPTRIVQADVQRLAPVQGSLPVRPVAASLTPGTGRASRPPEQVRTRPVVVTRAPRDMAPVLRSEGLAPDRAPAPAARVVPSARNAERRERPGGSASPGTEPSRGSERRDDRADRQTPPAAPGQGGAQRATPPAGPTGPPGARPETAPSRLDDPRERNEQRQNERAERDAERRARQTPPPAPGQNSAQRATPPAAPTAPSAPRAVPPPAPARPEAPRPSDRNEQRQNEQRQNERAERDAERRARQTPPPPPGQDSAQRATPPAPPTAPSAPRAVPSPAPARPEAPRPSDRNEQRQIERQNEQKQRQNERARQTPPAAPGQDGAQRATPPAPPTAPQAVPAPPPPQPAQPQPPRPEPRSEERRKQERPDRDAERRVRQAPAPTPAPAPASQPVAPPQPPAAQQPPAPRQAEPPRQAPPRPTPPSGNDQRERSQRQTPQAAPVASPRPQSAPQPAAAPAHPQQERHERPDRSERQERGGGRN